MDHSSNNPNWNEPTEGSTPSDATEERPPLWDESVSLLDILLAMVRHSRFIALSILAFTALGLVYVLAAPNEFVSEAQVVRETEDDNPGIGGMGGLGALRGMGIQLGGGAGGLTPDAYPSVLESREVRLAVARDTFYFPTLDKRMTFIQYANRDPGLLGIVLDYTIRLPWTILGHLTGSERTVSEEETKERRENRAIGQIGQMVASSVNRETGLMTISATAGSPELAAEVTRRSVQHLRSRVREIRTQKVQQSLSFVEQRFEEAQEELEAAENRLAAFLERNQNANSSQLRFERDRLQRQVTFKEQLYSNLQNQLTQTRLDLQRQQPVVTIVERPVPPPSPSAPQRTLILILFVAFGAVVGTAGAIGRSLFDSSGADQESRRKVEEIKEHVALPSRVKNGIERVRGSLTGNKNAENEAEEDPSSR